MPVNGGGRPPCPGHQVQAYRLEQAVSAALEQVDPWRSVLRLATPPRQTETAEDLARGWMDLDHAARARLMPTLIQRLELDEARQEMTIVLVPDASTVASAVLQALPTPPVNQ